MKQHTSKKTTNQSKNTQEKVKGFELEKNENATSKCIGNIEGNRGRKMHCLGTCVRSLSQ